MLPSSLTKMHHRLHLHYGLATIFLSGSMHPVRTTKATWLLALDEAVNNGLNMITIYVMWSSHQPFQDQPFNWSLPMQSVVCEHQDDGSCEWTLAHALWAAARRGLFVHLRLGPYVCAEYTYGGIPEWLPLKYPDMEMRRLSLQWMTLMREYLEQAITYLRANRLFAYQGGPILFAQIENELGDDGSVDDALYKNESLQKYADWCGAVAHELAPDVIWTMCNGLSANNTITTFNGDFAARNWLEAHGETGRIQIDQPAMWTEAEGGFQIWGEEPTAPSDYYWGRTARSMAYFTLQWFARGGSHLNYYMFYGGQNFGRMAAAGITTNYASDAVLCSSGQRHEPKFTHFQDLHRTLASVAHVMVNAESALLKNESLSVLLPGNVWDDGTDQQMFVYSGAGPRSEVIIAENNSNESVIVRIPSAVIGNVVLKMDPFSALLLIDGDIAFDTASIAPKRLTYARNFSDAVDILSCSGQVEPVEAGILSERTLTSSIPLEQTYLMVNSSLSSDYAWYGTTLSLAQDVPFATLSIETSQANAMVIYIDGRFVGASDTHNHKEGNATLDIYIGNLEVGNLSLAILSESLGYGNLLGRWGAGTRAKTKGIIGNVWLSSPSNSFNISLVDGRSWQSHAGLHGEHSEIKSPGTSSGSGGVWSTARFKTPLYDMSSIGLFWEISLGRGHFSLNGKDLGRYWNITQGNTDEASQRYYFLPPDLLARSGGVNTLNWFDAFNNSCQGFELRLSWIFQRKDAGFMDEVAFPMACI
ncbi:beta-galactosidase-1-like protein [Mayamaea pseudoterrestris]|nr:beta-galactosidase-1-like protein [Mayamaea pseudoterrestris]